MSSSVPLHGSRLEARGSRLDAQPPASSLQPSAGPQRILIIGPSNVGDAVLAGDVISRVHRRFPEAHLTLVVGARAHALFAGDTRVEALVDTDAYASVWGRLRLAAALWRYRPEAVVDLRHTLYPFLFAPWRAGRYLRTPPRALRHMRDRHLWRLSAQLPEAAGGTCLLWTSASDAAHVERLWQRWGLGRRRVVVVCPGARSDIKRWSTEGFAVVSDRLVADANVAVVFAGEPSEEPIVEAIRGRMRERALSAVGLTTVRQLGLVMRRAVAVLTNDSASLHVASAVGAPTVAIFGPTDEAKYGPPAPQHHVVRRRLFCSPCEQAQCRFHHECMRFVTVDEVYQSVRELLGHGAGDVGPRASVMS